MNDSLRKTQKPGTLSTFSGVFTPSILTILGIILFLRLGYVVGSAGLMQALVIIAIANIISVLTSFSLAAIATNLKVKGGGDYYLISRTLGVEFGGALGACALSCPVCVHCLLLHRFWRGCFIHDIRLRCCHAPDNCRCCRGVSLCFSLGGS